MGAACDAEAEEPVFLFLRQGFERHAERVSALQKAPPVGSFAQSAGAHRSHGLGPVAIGDGAKIAEGLESGFGGFRTQAAGLENFTAQTNRTPLLRDHAVML